MFHYHSGEVVRVGDKIRSCNERDGVVKFVIEPGSPDSENYDCPEGGILICEYWGDVPSLMLFTPPDREQWEDLDFIARREGSEAE